MNSFCGVKCALELDYYTALGLSKIGVVMQAHGTNVQSQPGAGIESWQQQSKPGP
jgi:hypothetical protein